MKALLSTRSTLSSLKLDGVLLLLADLPNTNSNTKYFPSLTCLCVWPGVKECPPVAPYYRHPVHLFFGHMSPVTCPSLHGLLPPPPAGSSQYTYFFKVKVLHEELGRRGCTIRSRIRRFYFWTNLRNFFPKSP